MENCPFCFTQTRGLGAVILLTPEQVHHDDGNAPITGAACIDCLGLLAMILDGLRGGRIRSLVERLESAGALRRN